MSKIGDQIAEVLRDFEEDYEKFETGNHSAGVRAITKRVYNLGLDEFFAWYGDFGLRRVTR